MNPLHPDVTALLLDPDLGAQPFSVTRYVTMMKQGKPVVEKETLLAVGSIQPAKAEELSQSPEGDRVAGSIVIRSPTEIRQTDSVFWAGCAWKVLSVNRYAQHGYYEAYLTRE